MTKKVLDVGNCSPDHGAVTRLIRGSFDAEVQQAHGAAEALQSLDGVDLILINRIFDADGGDGMSLIRQLKQDDDTKDIPVMLISNYQNYQQEAESLGAAPGFGKAELHEEATVERLQRWLGE